MITSPKKRPDAAPIRKTGVYTPQEIGAPTAMQVKANLHTVNMPRLSSSEGLDQRAVKSKGAEPKSSLITWLGLGLGFGLGVGLGLGLGLGLGSGSGLR